MSPLCLVAWLLGCVFLLQVLCVAGLNLHGMEWRGCLPPCVFVCAFVQDVVVLMWLGRRRKEEQGGAGSDNKCFCPSLCFLEKPCFCHFFQNNKPHKLEAVASITPSEGRSNKAKKKIDLQSSEAQQCVDKAWLASLFAFSSVSHCKPVPPPHLQTTNNKELLDKAKQKQHKAKGKQEESQHTQPKPATHARMSQNTRQTKSRKMESGWGKKKGARIGAVTKKTKARKDLLNPHHIIRYQLK